MHTYVSHDVRYTYPTLIDDIIKLGVRVSPRKQATRELHDVTLQLRDPTRSVPYDVGRKLHTPIASAEFIQLLGGYSDLFQLAAITRRFNDFADDGQLRGAYGPRLYRQWPYAINKFESDEHSRQVVLTLWKPNELESSSKDVPCTLSLGYRLHNGKLHAKTHMRSNDAWTGLPYDLAVFTALQRTLAWALDVETGTYTHHVWSLHLYERDLEAVDRLDVKEGVEYKDVMPPLTLKRNPLGDSSTGRWIDVVNAARWIGLNEFISEDFEVSVESAIHCQRLAPYQPRRSFCWICRYTFDSSLTACPTCWS